MKLLEEKILEKGKVLSGGVLKVGSFLNQNIDVKLLMEMGKEVKNHFNDKKITKVLTVEASGIAFAVAVANAIGVDMVFAKKTKAQNSDGALYTAECYSYTRKVSNILALPKDYLTDNDKVLIVDDFMAHGKATDALIEIVNQSGAKLVGVAIEVEKGFQGGGDKLREKGIDLLSLAIVDQMEEGKIVFRKQK